MTGTTIAAALDALVTVWTSAAPAGWAVIDSGPPIDPPLKFLVVGYDESESAEVVVTSETADPQMGHDLETFEVSSSLSLWDASGSVSADRAEIVAAFAAFKSALRADRTLGGVVAQSMVIDYDLNQSASPLGNGPTLRFTTQIKAWK